jgi:hypothetical protein
MKGHRMAGIVPIGASALATLCALAALTLLTACQSDDDPVIVAGTDELTLERGQSANLLGNDSIGGSPARAGAEGNVSFTLMLPPMGFTLSADGTQVVVGQDAPPGMQTIGYRLCDITQSARCTQGTARLSITRGPLQVVDDAFTLFKGDVANVLDNDTQGAGRMPLLAGQNTEVAPAAALPDGLWLSASGEVQVSPTAVPGEHYLRYRVCETGVAANCGQATATVRVPAHGRIEGRTSDVLLVRAAGLQAVPTPCETWLTGGCLRGIGPYALEPVPAADEVAMSFLSGPDDHFVFTDFVRHFTGRAVRVKAGQRVQLPRFVQAPFGQGGKTRLDQLAQAAAFTGESRGVSVGWNPGTLRRADATVPRFVFAEWAALRVGGGPADLPGGHTALIGGQVLPIETFGAALFRLADGLDGDPYGLVGADLVAAAGESLQLRIPVFDAVVPPATATLFVYDPTSARWLPAGEARLRDNGSAGLQYEAQTAHGGIWAVGRPLQTVSVSGCVTDEDGRPVPGAAVTASGVDHWTWSRKEADVAGNYTLPVKRNARVMLAALPAAAQDGDTPVSTRELAPLEGDTVLAPCLTSRNPPPLVLSFVGSVCEEFDCNGPQKTVLLAPDGSDLLAGQPPSTATWPLQRLQVGTYRLFSSLATTGYADLPRIDATRPVRVAQPGRAPQTYRLPGPAPAADAGGYWRLVEIDVDGACHVSVRHPMEHVAALPVAAGAAVPYCRP